MRSTNLIANDLDKLRESLSQKIEELVHDNNIKKQLHDLSYYVGILCLFNGPENAKEMISDNINNAKKTINSLIDEPSVNSIEIIHDLLNKINTFVKEYEISFKEYQGDTPETLNEKINKINQRFKDFQYAQSKSATIFLGTKENTLQSQPNAEINDKKEISPTSAKHINGVTSQIVVSGSPTKKSS